METERPHTGDLYTTIAMVWESSHHISGAWKSEVDLIPVWNPAKER